MFHLVAFSSFVPLPPYLDNMNVKDVNILWSLMLCLKQTKKSIILSQCILITFLNTDIDWICIYC